MAVNELDIKKSEKMDVYSVGYCLTVFLAEVDTVEAHIGDLAMQTKEDEDRLMVCGLQLDKDDNTCNILGDARQYIRIERKFQDCFNMTSYEILNKFIDKFKPEIKQVILKRMRAIDNNKLMIAPIKPGMKVLVDGKELSVETIKWYRNKDNGCIEYMVITNKDQNTGERSKVLIQDYGENLWAIDTESWGGTENNSRLIRMNKFGIVKPIKITDKEGYTFVIDNLFIYNIDKNKDIIIVGKWEKGKILLENTYKHLENSKAYKHISKNEKIINNHRKYIGPYGLTEINIIDIE